MTQRMEIECRDEESEKIIKEVKKTIKKEEPDVIVEKTLVGKFSFKFVQKERNVIKMKKRGIRILISLLLFIVGMLIKFDNILINNIIYLIAYLIVGFEILRKAVRNIFRGKIFDENFLMSLATIGAFLLENFQKQWRLCYFIKLGNYFKVMLLENQENQ